MDRTLLFWCYFPLLTICNINLIQSDGSIQYHKDLLRIYFVLGATSE